MKKIAATLNKSDFHKIIYDLLYMTIPSGELEIWSRFTHEEKVHIKKCQFFNQMCNLKIQNIIWNWLISGFNSHFKTKPAKRHKFLWFMSIDIPKHVLCCGSKFTQVTKDIMTSVENLRAFDFISGLLCFVDDTIV